VRRRWTVPAVLAMVACFTSGWILQGRLAGRSDPYQQARIFEEVLLHLRDFHVDSLTESELYVRATRGLLKELHDPYAALLEGKDLQRHLERTTGDYGGLGLQVDARNGWITVIAAMQGSPADRAGIRTGDQIIEVNGLSAANWTLDRAVDAMRGEVGTRVDLLVRREEVPTPLRFSLVRGRIHQPAVLAGVLLRDGVGYLGITIVRENSANELDREIQRLVAQGMRSLVLDLRSNPGGVRDEAVQAADLFLDPGQEILESRGRAPGDNRRWSDTSPPRWRTMPVVVLVNRGTASAAEIIAGALQDHDRALLAGDTTYGKGIVQTVFPLSSEAALRMTTARWYTPSGRSIQGAALDSAMGAAHIVPVATFRSDGGRPLNGAGGLVPDIILEPDTLTAGEVALILALQSHVAVFRDVLSAYALELRHGSAIRTESFEVTAAMRNEIRRRLAQRGVTLTDSIVQGASKLLDDEVGYEIARYVFGPEGERRRRIQQDQQIQRAAELVRRSSSPQQLLGMLPRSSAH
jgi:carboxyl-terminal processing protease